MLSDRNNIESTEAVFSQSRKFRLFVVIWLIATTIVLNLTMEMPMLVETIESAFLTLVACYFFYFKLSFFDENNLQLLPELIKIACLSLMLLIFDHWGLVYIFFMILIVMSDAYRYKTRDFLIILIVSILAPIYYWWMMNGMADHTLTEKTFYLAVPFVIFASGIIARTLASESLNVQLQKNELDLNVAKIKREQDELTNILNNIEGALISIDENNEIYFYNTSARSIFPLLLVTEQQGNNVPLTSLHLIDSSGRAITLKEIVDNSTREPYRVDLSSTVDGKSVKLNILVSKIFDKNDKYHGAMISIHNLTAEEIVEQSKIEFAALASHEIRTPLTIIVGYLNMMLNGKEFEYNEQTKEYLTRLYNSSSGLVKLANDILTMSTIDQGAVRVEIKETDLATLITGIVTEQRKVAEQKSLGIDYTINQVPSIETDQSKVIEILEQLIGNAVKFSSSGIVDVQLDMVGNEITISVEDSGVGIPDGARDKIFNKFSQVEDWKSHKNAGSGLGLYISKSLARRIGGDLVYSETTKGGSKFSLILPRKYPFPEDLKMRETSELKEFIKGF